MPVLVRDPMLANRLKAERMVAGADHYDEVWEGVYVMAPLPPNEHQQIVGGLFGILQHVIAWAGLGQVFPGINLTDRDDDWTFNYRVPDVAVFMNGSSAIDCGTHWKGAADFLIEVCSPEDETRAKIPFYGELGVKELIIVDRNPWTVELHRLVNGGLKLVGASSLAQPIALASGVMPLRLRLVQGSARPLIEVTHNDGQQRWLV